METIKIGTRGSKLALWQAYYVSDKLTQAGVKTEVKIIETKGDKILDVSIAKIGSKGVFTEEIEEQLANGQIDIAVHSAKDMQSELPDGFELIAFTEREKVNDVLVSSNPDFKLENKNLIIGTSSTRRVAILKRLYPQVQTVAVRGNLQTRISKMKDGACGALMLAYAGMYRMGYSNMIVEELNTDVFTPPVGQGSVTVECATSMSDSQKTKIREAINHTETEFRLRSERAFLRILQGGCSIPVFGLATLSGNELAIEGGIVSLDGSEIVRKKLIGKLSEAEKLGEQLGELVLSNGGADILQNIRVNG